MVFMNVWFLQELTHEQGKGSGSSKLFCGELWEIVACLHPGADVGHTGTDALACSHYGTALPPAQPQGWRCFLGDGMVLQTHCQCHGMSQAR